MTTTPLISVIMPVYNAMPYLPMAIESVINQTYQNWECIIVDNNSADDSLEIVRQYAQQDARIKIFSENKQGAHFARNCAIQNCRGELISFCDADDEIHPQKLAEQWKYLVDNNLDALFTAHNWIVNGEHIPITHLTQWNINQFYRTRKFPCMASIMVKRSHLMQTSLYKNIKNGEDVELFLCQLPKFAQMGFMNRIFYHYRMHQMAVSRTGFTNLNMFLLHYIACNRLNSDDFTFPFTLRDLIFCKNWHLQYWIIKFHFIYFCLTPPYIWGRVWRKIRANS